MALSVVQQHVIDLMKNGWELGQDKTMAGRAWLQKDGIGRGGESETVSSATVHALWKRGLVVSRGYDFPTERFVLAEEE